MESNQIGENLNTFEVEASPSVKPKKSIVIKHFEIKEKLEDKIIYCVSYVYSAEAMTSLEKLKVEAIKEKDFKITKINFQRNYSKILEEYLQQELQKLEITYPIKYEDIPLTQYMKSPGTEGLEYIDKETIDKQRSIITYMIKKVGMNLLSGKSIMNVSLPIYIFDYRSLLESWAYQHKIAHNFLPKAADCTNPIDRLKFIMTYVIVGTNLNLVGSKPFNPILGETFQTKIGESMIYIEQTSHHPPIMTYYVKHPKYVCFGHKGIEASTGANSVTGEHLGKMYIQFNDGNLFKLTPGKFTITGLTIGRRFINFENFLVEDLTNNLIAFIRVNPDDRNYFSKLFKSKESFPDYFRLDLFLILFFRGFIAETKNTKYESKTNSYKLIDNKNAISNLEGEWSTYVKIDDALYWKQGNLELQPMERMDYTLPSDSTLREDLILFKHNHIDYAQEAKVYLEEIQRNDRMLRKIYCTKK